MKFIVSSAELLKRLSNINGVITTNPVVPILENGVTYHVSLDKDLSTGMFLDQRANRAWLTRNCNENTHVLNCFAKCL